MLLTLFLWFYVTVVTFLAGHAVLQFGRWLTGSMPVLPTPVICLIGVAGLTTVLGWLWLAIPISATTHLGMVAVLLFYAAWQQPRVVLMPGRYPPFGWVAVGLLFSVVWLRSGQLPRLADTGGYHAPMIEWIYRYPVVPGLANLNYRFGFNNSWFLLSALFRFQLTPDVVWHGLNGWLMTMVGWFSVAEWQRLRNDQHRPFSAWLGSWLAIGLLFIFHWTLSSPSPDLPTHVYIVLCFWVWLRRSESDQNADGWAWLLLLLSLSALTTKLSAVTVLLLPLRVLLPALRRGRWRVLLTTLLTVIFCTGYWFAGNVQLSGYLAYPSLSSLVDWFAVDWKVPRTVIAAGLRNLQEGTRGDAGPTPSIAWVPYWFRTRPLLEQVLALALLLAPVPLLVQWRRALANIPGYGVAFVAGWLGVGFWFLLAPEIRFGAGNVLVTLGLCYGPAVWWRRSWPVRTAAVGQGTLILLGVTLLVAALRREPVNGWLPTGYPARTLDRYQADGHSVYYPTGDQRVINGIRGYWGECYDAPLPCSPYPLPGLHWRGNTLTDGFRTGVSAAP